MIELGVNVDHVATVRQARRTYEPDPVWAAIEAHLGGADGITVHLREDRRHIQDEDVRRLRELTHIKLNLEMAATDEMVGIAARIKPEMAMLVPEGRHEVTTEGGLDVVASEARLRQVVSKLRDAGIIVSVFIDAEARQVEAAKRIGASVCEIHTGPYAHAFHSKGRDAESPAVMVELEKITTTEDKQLLHDMITKQFMYTGSRKAKTVLDAWDTMLPKFVKVMPIDYKRVLAERRAATVKGSKA